MNNLFNTQKKYASFMTWYEDYLRFKRSENTHNLKTDLSQGIIDSNTQDKLNRLVLETGLSQADIVDMVVSGSNREKLFVSNALCIDPSKQSGQERLQRIYIQRNLRMPGLLHIQSKANGRRFFSNGIRTRSTDFIITPAGNVYYCSAKVIRGTGGGQTKAHKEIQEYISVASDELVLKNETRGLIGLVDSQIPWGSCYLSGKNPGMVGKVWAGSSDELIKEIQNGNL